MSVQVSQWVQLVVSVSNKERFSNLWFPNVAVFVSVTFIYLMPSEVALPKKKLLKA